MTCTCVVNRIEFKSDRQHFADNARETDLGENGINISTVRKNDFRLKIIVYAVSIVLVFVAMSPFITLLIEFTGFRTDNPARVLKIIPQRIKQLGEFFSTRVVLGFVNSVIVTVSSTILNVYFSALTAHAITSYNWKLKKIFSNFILALMMIPSIVATAGFVQLAYKFNLNNKLIVFILPSIASPVSVVFMRLYLESVYSKELIESARLDGAGEFRIFNQIILPILKPAIATQAIFAMASSWNDAFLPVVLLLKQTKMTLPVVLLLNYASGESIIPMFVSTVPLVIAFLFLSKHIVEGVQLGSVKM